SSGSSVTADRIVVASAGETSAASIVVGGSLTATQAHGDGADIVLVAADGTGPDATPTAQTILSGGALPAWSAGASQGTLTIASGGSLQASAGGVFAAAGSDVSLAGDIDAATSVNLRSSTGAVSQTAGTITAATLGGSAGTSATLDDANQVATLS